MLALILLSSLAAVAANHCPFADIVWILDGSTSMAPVLEYETVLDDRFGSLRRFVTAFTNDTVMSPTQTRQAFVVYAGPYHNTANGQYIMYTTLGPHLNLTDPAASNKTAFLAAVEPLRYMGGTTNTGGALDYVRQHVLTPETYRPGSRRFVILGTDGFPTNIYGNEDPAEVQRAELAAQQLVQEDNVTFVFLKIGNDYPLNWFHDTATYIYNTSFPTLSNLLHTGFLCQEEATLAPTATPTVPCTQTAWARDDRHAKCFFPMFEQWGWTQDRPLEGNSTFVIYASTARCDTSKGWRAGVGTISHQGTRAIVTFQLEPGVVATEVHFYVGSTPFSATGHRASYTVSPGRFPYKGDGGEGGQVSIHLPTTAPIYYTLHWEVRHS